jgi:hypothetical protein
VALYTPAVHCKQFLYFINFLRKSRRDKLLSNIFEKIKHGNKATAKPPFVFANTAKDDPRTAFGEGFRTFQNDKGTLLAGFKKQVFRKN